MVPMEEQTDQNEQIKALSNTPVQIKIKWIIKPASKISREKKHYEINGAETTTKKKKFQVLNFQHIPKKKR